jgi:hypothetical protein
MGVEDCEIWLKPGLDARNIWLLAASILWNSTPSLAGAFFDAVLSEGVSSWSAGLAFTVGGLYAVPPPAATCETGTAGLPELLTDFAASSFFECIMKFLSRPRVARCW